MPNSFFDTKMARWSRANRMMQTQDTINLALFHVRHFKNWYLAAAGTLTFAIGLVHSLLGERLIFQRVRSAGFIPANGGTVPREPHIGILWAG